MLGILDMISLIELRLKKNLEIEIKVTITYPAFNYF